MHLTHKAAQAAITAIAAACLWAPTATADPVEVSDNGVHCTPVVPAGSSGHQVQGGCHLQVISIGDIDLEVDVHPTGGHTQGPLCEYEVEARLDEQGQGYIQDFDIFPGQSGCGTGFRACDEPEAHGGGNGPWPLATEETGKGQETMTVDFCMVISGVGRCEGPITIELMNDGEDYFGEMDGGVPCNNNPNVEAEFLGNFILLNEEGEEVHIIHPIE